MFWLAVLSKPFKLSPCFLKCNWFLANSRQRLFTIFAKLSTLDVCQVFEDIIRNFPVKGGVSWNKRSFKNDVTKKSAIFENPSLALFVSNISTPVSCHRLKSGKIFPDKPSAKVHSGFNVLGHYAIPHTRLLLRNS